MKPRLDVRLVLCCREVGRTSLGKTGRRARRVIIAACAEAKVELGTLLDLFSKDRQQSTVRAILSRARAFFVTEQRIAQSTHQRLKGALVEKTKRASKQQAATTHKERLGKNAINGRAPEGTQITKTVDHVAQRILVDWVDKLVANGGDLERQAATLAMNTAMKIPPLGARGVLVALGRYGADRWPANEARKRAQELYPVVLQLVHLRNAVADMKRPTPTGKALLAGASVLGEVAIPLERMRIDSAALGSLVSKYVVDHATRLEVDQLLGPILTNIAMESLTHDRSGKCARERWGTYYANTGQTRARGSRRGPP